MGSRIAIVFALVLLCGCATVEPLPANYEAPDPVPADILEKYCYEPKPVVADMVLAKESNTYRIYEVELEAGFERFDDDSPITFEFYEQRNGGPSPVAILLPILNGGKELLWPFAWHFASNGYSVIIVDTVQRNTLLEDMIDPEPAIRQTILRHRRVIDWVETRPDLDASRIGVFGASLGGFNALYLAAFDERVSVVSPALAGGSLADIFVASDERRVAEAVNGVKQELSLTDEALHTFLAEKIDPDTLTVAPHMNADRVLMVLAEQDTAVPYEQQLALWKAMGEPEAIMLPTGHITAAAYIFYLRTRVLDFFERKFAEDVGYGTAALPPGHCGQIASADDDGRALIDRTQESVHNVISGAARYIDSFFGSTELEAGSNVSRGSLSLGGVYDERDGFRERIRVRARIALPALKERTRLVIGRSDSDGLIDGTANYNVDTIPARFDSFEDEDWLIGVGFARDQTFARGWNFSVGARFSNPIEPYARANYRWNKTFGDAWLWRVRPSLFVQSRRGAGASLNNILDFAASENWLLRSWTVLLGEDEVEGLGWTQQFTAYNSISEKFAMSYNLFASGETQADVPLRDYGLELRFRRRISRDWLFVELLTFVTWPREFLSEERESNLGIGLEFEMQFGDWPGRSLNQTSSSRR